MSRKFTIRTTLVLVCGAAMFGSMAGCPDSTGMADGLMAALGLSVTRTDDVRGAVPTIQGPSSLSVECDGAGNAAALSAWLADVTFTDGCGGAELTNDFVALSDACGATGSATVTWTVTDDCRQSAMHTATFSIVDTTPPVLTVPADISVDCGDPGAGAALIGWLASATGTDMCGAASITHVRAATPTACTAMITWTATDACGNATSASAMYTTMGDTTVPTLALNGEAEITVECGDEFVDPGVTVLDDCDALIAAEVTGAVDVHAPGDYVLTYEAADACGNAAAAVSRIVHVVDTLPPEIVPNAAMELWPPNHRTVTLTLEDIVGVVDLCQGPIDVNSAGRILELYSDEPDNANGDGNTTGDIAIVNDFSFTVRVERRGGGNGRVYGVRFEVADDAGNTAELTGFVHVPHDQSGAAAINDGRNAGHSVFP